MGWVVARWLLVRTREMPVLYMYSLLLYRPVHIEKREKSDVLWVSLPLI
jgi:hypothetical protein